MKKNYKKYKQKSRQTLLNIEEFLLIMLKIES